MKAMYTGIGIEKELETNFFDVMFGEITQAFLLNGTYDSIYVVAHGDLHNSLYNLTDGIENSIYPEM
jgi:hypothetical protein